LLTMLSRSDKKNSAQEDQPRRPLSLSAPRAT
jgi:hypothetical protein